MNNQTFIKIDESVTNLSDAEKFVNDDNCGAVATFTGVTRRDHRVVALEFETHTPLATNVLAQIVQTHRTKNPELRHVFIHHRIGRVPVGQGNVIIAVSSPHRASAFSAVQAIMDELKALLPVWKKEIFDDQTYRWQENVEFRPH